MRSILMFAGVVAALGVFMAQVADRMSSSSAQAKAVAQARTVNPFASKQNDVMALGVRSVALNKDARGHFKADARVDGRSIDFMVDTGATVIALTESDAARIGIRPFAGDYTTTVSTANGSAKAAPARLASIDVGGVVVRDVEALIMPDKMLGQNLLGMAFLSRLKRFEYANGKLVLEQ